MNKKEILKKEILKKVKDFYEISITKEKFSEGKSRINYAGRIYNEKELINLVDSSLDFWLTYGKYSKKFEKEFADFLKIKYAFLVNSGSSANLLAISSLTSPLLKNKRIKKGDEVITIAAGFPTTVSPIVQNGAIPVFIDIDLGTYNIDIKNLKKALTKKTKAVILAHTLGNPFNIKEVLTFCKNNNLWLIEDNCDSLGSIYNNKLTGTWGDIGTSSFYPPHHMTMGEGGAIYTNNPLLKKIILSMRDWGRDCWCDSGVDNTCGHRFSQKHGKLPLGYDHKYVYSHFGYNLKVTDMQAAIGCAQIKKLPFFIKKRQENFKILQKGLRELDNYFILPRKTKNSEPSWFGFFITIKDNQPFSRNDVVKHLENKNIQTRNLFAGNIVRQPLFQNLKLNKDYKIIGTLKNTDKIMNDGFWLGVYPGIKKSALNYIIKTLKDFVYRYGN